MKKTNNSGKPPGRGSANDGRPQVKALGPIDNLEAHVSPDWWRRIFNPLYLKTDADVIADETITSQEIDTLLDGIEISPEAHILDLCCGQGRHTLELARRGFKAVEGLDRSHYLIQKARKQTKSEGLEVRFREGDARKLPHPPETFDFVLILGNSFGYFETIEDDERVLREVMRVLKPGGKLVLDLTDGLYLRTHYQPRSWEWADKKLFVCRERAISSDGQRLITREIISHTEKGVIADQFYAERLYDNEGIAALVQRAGFSDVVQHQGFVPSSQRNQDLGMMAQRMLITCTAHKPVLIDKQSEYTHLQNIVVIMGDPRKRDEVKPTSVFDDDDFHTISQMQKTLECIKSRNFTYLDDHDRLMENLRFIDGDIDLVLNLCDEGFDNDPRKELHIPALLEMLHIPFTGAGPQCLAFCYDKSLVRGIAKEMGIAVPEGMLVKAEDTMFDLPVPFPVIVKPNFGDSSFGIIQRSVVYNPEELLDAIAEVRGRFGYEKPILVEEFLTGQDLSVGILGNPPEDYTVLPVIEENYSSLPEGLPHICGYEAKWLENSPYWNLGSVPAALSEDVRHLIVDACIKLFIRLECRDYCRFDWRVSANGTPKLLEVNPNPGWCWDGHLAKMAHLAGMTYGDMLEAILSSAERRLGKQEISVYPQAGWGKSREGIELAVMKT
jgi:D-alanine-D-alanine ligase